MKSFVALSLAAALVVVGCTVTSSDGDKPDASAGTDSGAATPDSGSTDSDAATDVDAATGDDKDAGGDASTEPKEVVEVPGNDSLDKAQAVPVGSLVKASLDSAAGDFFAITIPGDAQDGILRLTLDEASPDLTPGIKIYSAAKAELKTEWAADGTARPLVVNVEATAGKVYYAEVVNGIDGTSVPYTVKVEFTPVADTFERNDSFDTAKAAPAAAFDLFLFAGTETNGGEDKDFFTIDVPAGKTKVRVKITNKSTAEAPQTHGVRIYKADKSELSTAWASGPQADLDTTFDVEAAGKHYLSFEGANHTAGSPVTISFE